jgi:hypothetical protein
MINPVQFGELSATHELIASLLATVCVENGGNPNWPEFHDQLLLTLEADGFQRSAFQHSFHSSITRHLRGLAESSEGGGGQIDVTAIVMVVACILCAGFASGLTQVWLYCPCDAQPLTLPLLRVLQGLLSLDEMEMQIKARSGTEQEKRYAAKLIPIISRHHLLLVTLMLWNATATEALPIFLSALVPEYIAIIISVTLVLFVGEIIPASILTGPNQLKITAFLAPLVYFVLAIFFPLAYPISIALDHIIGHSDMTMYNRTEISTMMQLHLEEGVKRKHLHKTKGAKGHPAPSSAELYEAEEVNIIAGALKYRELQVSQVMTPAANVYMVSVADTLNYKLVYEIFKSGYSRIPVYESDRNDVVGLILAKDLIFVDPEVCEHIGRLLSGPYLTYHALHCRTRHPYGASWTCSAASRAWCGTTASWARP